MWKNDKLKYTAKDVALVIKELKTVAFGLANAFKDFIINNSNPTAEMEVRIHDDQFGVSCNKFKNVGEKLKAYKIWDSIDKDFNIILHTDTKKIPDLDKFRLYFVTLLVHNLDGQVMNYVADKITEKYGWGIPIHDAMVCSPAAADDVRTWYNEALLNIHNNRKKILRNFFKSIGISSLALDEWENLKSMVVPFEGNLETEFSMPLK